MTEHIGSLTRGTTLGSYTVAAQIGAGGMGEVYRARDTKLDRDVALKALMESRHKGGCAGTGFQRVSSRLQATTLTLDV